MKLTKVFDINEIPEKFHKVIKMDIEMPYFAVPFDCDEFLIIAEERELLKWFLDNGCKYGEEIIIQLCAGT